MNFNLFMMMKIVRDAGRWRIISWGEILEKESFCRERSLKGENLERGFQKIEFRGEGNSGGDERKAWRIIYWKYEQFSLDSLKCTSCFFCRLTSFQDTLPKLEKWYGKYGILTKIDANKPRGEKYLFQFIYTFFSLINSRYVPVDCWTQIFLWKYGLS